jgi:hypothetical protein
VTVNVEVWNGELEASERVHETWLKLSGVNPKWCKWGTLAQFISALGVLVEVDWHSAFKSLCEVVRVKIHCKDMFSISEEQTYKLGKKFYKIGIQVEADEKVMQTMTTLMTLRTQNLMKIQKLKTK